jgi:hypothetical protein
MKNRMTMQADDNGMRGVSAIPRHDPLALNLGKS